MNGRVIGPVTSYQAGQRLLVGKVNHYISDGEIMAADLVDGIGQGP